MSTIFIVGIDLKNNNKEHLLIECTIGFTGLYSVHGRSLFVYVVKFIKSSNGFF